MLTSSSHLRCSINKGVLKNFAKINKKIAVSDTLFLKKAVGLRTTTLLKKTLRHRCFPVNIATFLRSRFL